jgi:hypothetical protein
MATKKGAKRAAIDWVGGIVSLPTFVEEEGGPYRPELMLWMTSQGQIVGMDTARPGELKGQIVQHFWQSSRRPMMGPPHVPTSIRIASEELAAALRAELGSEIAVVCAPTPELDLVVAAMTQQMAAEGEPATTYLAPGLDAAAMGAFFEAAAGLFDAKPWTIAVDDESLLLVTCEALGLRDAVICFMGQLGESVGLVLFHDLDGYDAFIAAALALELGEQPELPAHFAINFESADALNAELREEIAAHRWKVASPEAYPWLTAIDADVIGRPPTAAELTRAEVLALALPEVLAEKAALLRAWAGQEAFSRTFTVAASQGSFELTIRAIGEAEIDERARRAAPAARVTRPVDPAAERARKAKRKAERSARKKGR